MKNAVVFSFILLLSACGTSREKQMSAPPEELLMSKQDSTFHAEIDAMFKTVEAKVIYEPFVNKAGKLIDGIGDYYLMYENQDWFIKFSESSVKRDELAKLKDQTATFSVMEREGLWDTDNPEVQSRVGKYVVIHEIIKP